MSSVYYYYYRRLFFFHFVKREWRSVGYIDIILCGLTITMIHTHSHLLFEIKQLFYFIAEQVQSYFFARKARSYFLHFWPTQWHIHRMAHLIHFLNEVCLLTLFEFRRVAHVICDTNWCDIGVRSNFTYFSQIAFGLKKKVMTECSASTKKDLLTTILKINLIQTFWKYEFPFSLKI